MPKLARVAVLWVPFAGVITILCGMVYLTVQQSLRQSANDPQIQMAEDAAGALARGAAEETVLPATQVDIATSLSPFAIVFNTRGDVVAASGRLHGRNLQLPPGVLDRVRTLGENRVTLQPERSVRIASVIHYYEDGPRSGFVLAGRSLREIESREQQTQTFVAIAWVVSVAISFLVVSVFSSSTVWQ
jgi:hypothetical protein